MSPNRKELEDTLDQCGCSESVRLVSSEDRRDAVGEKERNGSHVVAIQVVLVNSRVMSSDRKSIQDEGDELLTCGSVFPGSSVSSFKDLSL